MCHGLLDYRRESQVNCKHEDVYIDESGCGHIALLCFECSKYPLAEIRENCKCSYVSFKEYWGYISEDEAWAIYKRENGTQKRKESK